MTVDIALHWLYCNVYPYHTKTILRKVHELFKEYSRLRRYVPRKRGEKYWKDFGVFTETLNLVLDVRADYDSTRRQEKLWGVLMCEDDKKFYEMQCLNPPKGYCLVMALSTRNGGK